jgi:predicted ATPase
MGLWLSHGVSGELIAASEVAQECLSLATRHEDPGAAARANRYMGYTRFMMGAPVEARRHLEQTLEICATGQKIDLHFLDDDRVHALSVVSRVLWFLGYPEQAVATASQALAGAQGVGHAVTTAMAFLAQAILGSIGGDPERAAIFADKTLAICVEHDLADWACWAHFSKGDLLARRGEPQQGIAVMRNALAGLERIGAEQARTMHLGCLAAAHKSLGQFEVGLGLLDEAFRTAEKTKERVFEAELHRLRGDLLLTSGKKREAETELEQALTVARNQEARFWELRAATSLARLWRDQGRYLEARNVLGPVYNWFTEGFQFPDLKSAKLLLNEVMPSLPEETGSI